MLTHALPTSTTRRIGHLLLLVLTLSISFAVWATQPSGSDAGLAGTRLFDVRVLLSTPGAQPLMPRLIVHEGERAGFKSGAGANEIAVDFQVDAGADGVLFVATEIKSGGIAVGKPTIGVRPGEPGSIAISDDRGGKVELTLWVSESRGAAPDAVSDGTPRLPDVMTAPRYPADALDAGIEGEVVLDLNVDANGIVRDVRVVQSQPAAVFDQAAIAAARGWWLNPAAQEPGALPGWVRAPVKFSTHE